MTTERKPILFAILGAALLLAVLAAGCTTTQVTPTPTPTTAPPTTVPTTVGITVPTVTTVPTTAIPTTTTPPATATTVPPTPAGAAVVIQNFGFNPQTVTIPVGGTVTWTNLDTAQHTVRNIGTMTVGPGQMFQSKILGKGDNYSYTFTSAGTYQYQCGIHTSMTGTVFVK
jgi:plastocyanin